MKPIVNSILGLFLAVASCGEARSADYLPDQVALIEATRDFQEQFSATPGNQLAAQPVIARYAEFIRDSTQHEFVNLQVAFEVIEVRGNEIILTVNMKTPTRSNGATSLHLLNEKPILLSKGVARYLSSLHSGDLMVLNGHIVGPTYTTFMNPAFTQLYFQFDQFNIPT